MARSYKKNPVIKDHQSGKSGKQFANRRVRNSKEIIPSGNSYRKIYCSYDIHDYVFRETYAEHRQRFESDTKSYLNGAIKWDPREEKGWYDDNQWEKCYLRK